MIIFKILQINLSISPFSVLLRCTITAVPMQIASISQKIIKIKNNIIIIVVVFVTLAVVIIVVSIYSISRPCNTLQYHHALNLCIEHLSDE